MHLPFVHRLATGWRAYLDRLLSPLCQISSDQLVATTQQLAREIQERQQVELALRQSQTCFQAIFNSTAIGVALSNAQGQAIATNRALQQMLGYSDSELRRLPMATYTLPEDGMADWPLYQELMAGQRDSYQVEKRYRCKDGQILWGHLTVTAVPGNAEQPPLSICLLENITDRKQSEAALQHYQDHLEELVGERTLELIQANEQLSWQATHDPLTNLVNRRKFEQCLETALLNARTLNHEHILCYLDLDRFKAVNDACGHTAGDELLRQISALLQMRCRKTDLLARLGGDEFGLLLYQCPLDVAQQVVQALRESVQEFRFVWQGKTFTIGVSIGLVIINSSSESLDQVLRAADTACYRAKNQGRNRVCLYENDDTQMVEYQSELRWLDLTRAALANDRFSLYYQPIQPLSRCQSLDEYYEVLLRLPLDTGEVVLPMTFLPTAERYDLMPAIDAWVIQTFLQYLSQYPPRDWQRCLYAINLSKGSVNSDQFIPFLKQQLDTYQIPAQALCFEVTETIATTNLQRMLHLIVELRELGCRISLSDFGSGMSSFAHLKYLSVDYLKIGREFVEGIADDPITCVVVEAINRIGHVIGMEVIAEFVDSTITLQQVKALGVDYVQGFGVAEPRPLLPSTRSSLCNLLSPLESST